MVIKLFHIRTFRIIFIVSVVVSSIFLYQKHQDQQIYCKNCNLILISVDTLRADHMGIYGYKKSTTPNIDNWAKSAIVFEKMYTIFPLTPQSFYSLFTGEPTVLNNQSLQESYSRSMNNNYSNLETLPKTLKEHGYFNAAFVTNPIIKFIYNFKLNFDHFNFVNTSKFTELNPAIYSYTYNDQKMLSQKAIKFLQKNKKNKFFLWLHYLNPHHPYNAPLQYVCNVNNSYCNIDQRSILDPEDNSNSCLTKLTTKELEKEIALYDGEIKTTDEQIGLILTEIENLNLNNKTIVVFYSDHGEGFDHDMYHHGNSLYESSVRIPFIVSIPSKDPQRIKGLADNSDIMHGILDFLGLSRKSDSLIKSLVDKPSEKGKPYVYFMTPTSMTGKKGVTDGKYKYIETNNTFCRYKNYSKELYDLSMDPKEEKNIVDTSPAIANDLRKQIDNFDKYDKSTPKKDTPDKDMEIINTLKEIGY